MATSTRIMLTLACVATAFTGGASAYADTCLEDTTYAFSPPLTTVQRLGTVTATWSRTCVIGFSGTGTKSFAYLGNCVLAQTENGTLLSMQAGGIAILEADGDGGYLKAGVLVPDAVCNTSSATGPLLRVL